MKDLLASYIKDVKEGNTIFYYPGDEELLKADKVRYRFYGEPLTDKLRIELKELYGEEIIFLNDVLKLK